MNQSRRGFLTTLAGAIASAAALGIDDPERLLWVPGQKTIFLPPERPIQLVQTVWELAPEVIGGSIYPNGPLYIRDRYRVTTNGQDVVFDSNWQPTNGFDRRERRAFTEQEMAQLAQDMAYERTLDMRRWGRIK